jgi:PAS domain S-box-containing protein
VNNVITVKNDIKSATTILRHKKVEELLKTRLSNTVSQLSESETLKLIHELEVHQIELDLQNDELMAARSAAHTALEKYTELYDFAPTGYFTLSREGKILELNLCGAQMLGKERSHLINSSFGFFVTDDSTPIFNNFLGKAFAGKAKETCELSLVKNNEDPLHVHLTGRIIETSQQCHVTITDITERKRAEGKLLDLIEKNPMSIQIVDMEGFTLQVNDAHTLLFGSVPPRDFSIFADLQNRNPVLGNLILRAKSGEVVHLPDLYYNAHDIFKNLPDVPVWIRAIIFPLKDDKGKPERFVFMHENISERKRTEEEIHRMNSFLDSIIENIPNMIFIKEANSLKFVRFNHAGEDLLGIPKENMIGKSDQDFFLKKQADFFMEKDREVLQSKEMMDIPEEPIQTKHQGTRILHTMKVPILNALGEPEYLLGISEDITERKQIENALAQQNDALLKLNNFSIELSMLSSQDSLEGLILQRIKEFTGAAVAIFSEYNPVNKTTSIKQIEMEPGRLEKVVKILGRQLKNIYSFVSDEMYREMTTEIIGVRKTLYEASLGEVSKPMSIAIQTLLKVDRFIGVAYMIEGKLYGTSLFGMAKGQPDPPKKILENFIFLAAVTLRRKQAEFELRISEEKYRNIFENVQDVFYQTNLAGNILEISPSIKYLTEFSRDELLSTPVHNLYFNPNDRDHFLNAIMINNELRDYEIKLRTKTGTIKYISINAKLIHDTDGKPSYIDGALRDITARKIADNELIIEKEKAEESDRLKTAFLQNISHEIRTPMNAIIGFSKMLGRPDLSEEKRKTFSNIIIRSSEQLLSVVTDILTISSIETNQTKTNVQKVRINTIIEDILNTFKSHALNQNVVLSAYKSLSDTQSDIDTDKEKVIEIMTNLLTNALKFTHEGFIEFGYELNENMIEFYVKDSGIGIRSEMQDKIFDYFRQANLTISQEYGGNGLGLAISKGYVELLGGKIWVESVLGKGSVFYFTIPYKQV